MVTFVRFVSVHDAAGMADYYMRETQPRDERDMDREAMRLPHPGEHEGTVPEFRQDASEAASRAFRLSPDRTPTRPEVENLFHGLRADGGPTGKRITANYERASGKEFRQKHFIEIVASWDTSVSLSLANAETQGGRALIMSGLHNAAQLTMQQTADQIGFIRLGAGGRGGEQPADLAWIAFAHHTTRPDKQGNVWPNYHIHFLVPNAGVTHSDGKVRAIHMQKMLGFGGQLSRNLQDNTAGEFKRIGLEFRRADSNARQIITTDIPDSLRLQFIRRSAEMVEYAKRKIGADDAGWQALPAKVRTQLMQQARNLTQGAKTDGMANRPAWRDRMVAAGMRSSDPIGISWLAGTAATVMTQTRHLVLDLARPVAPEPSPSLPARMQRLRQEAIRTEQRFDMIQQQRQARGQPAPNLARMASIGRAMVPAIQRQALRMRQTLEAIQRAPERAFRVGQSIRDAAVARAFAIRQTLTRTQQRKGPAMAPLPQASQIQASQTTPITPRDRIHVDDAGGRYQVAITFAAKAGDTSSDLARTRYHERSFTDRGQAEAFAARVEGAGAITNDRWKAQGYDAAPRPGPDAEERMVRVYARKVAAGEIPMSQAVASMMAREDRKGVDGFNPVHHTATYKKEALSGDNLDARQDKWTSRIGDAVEKIHNGTAWQDTQKAPTQIAPTPRMKMER